MENLLINYQTGILFLISYLLGSIPFGYLIFKIKNNNDIRNYGSGNIGATNVNRLLGKKLGFLTLLLECKYSRTKVGLSSLAYNLAQSVQVQK